MNHECDGTLFLLWASLGLVLIKRSDFPELSALYLISMMQQLQSFLTPFPSCTLALLHLFGKSPIFIL